MKKYISFFCCFLFIPFSFSQNFPAAKKTSLTITKHGITYVDDYTWLENYNSKEVTDWVSAENQITDSHTEEIKKTYSIASKIKEYDNLSTNSLPVKKGRYFYSRYRTDKAKPPSLYYRKKLNEDAIELVNVSKIYNDNNVILMDFYPSRNSVLLAYQATLNGSDRREIRFVDINKSNNLDDKLTNVKFSNVAWNLDKGIFYKKNSNTNVFAKDSTYQLFYHKIGTIQEDDKLIFDTTKSESNFSFFTKENKLFIIEIDKNETKKNYYSADLFGEDFIPEKFLENDTSDFKFLNYNNGKIYYSSKEFGWGEVRSFDIKDRSVETVVIPQIYTHLLVDADFYENYIICKYKTATKNYISIYDNNGTFIRKFDAPSGMDFEIKFLDTDSKELYVSFYSYVIPFQNFKLNIETGKYGPYYSDFFPPKPTLFPFDYFETKSITYKSRDGKDIPITIVYKKGMPLDGNNPTLLKAYGGFGLISGPVYDTGLLYFMEKGGVFAFAEIRGGGEKGTNWHQEGKGLNKMNSFNDFIDAAEFLIKEKYTSPSKLAITGGSNGGLLVGVAMTQRPELFKVAIPKVGLFDMAKFQNYTTGKFWLDEYGDAERENEYKILLKYSPYNNINEAINYPTTLIITSENDDRVPPIHSYKFAAKLQNRIAQKNPIYLKTLSNSGHNGKISNYKSYVEDKAEFYSFLLYHLKQ